MQFFKRNWWKLLPFILFFFGLGGVIAFTVLLIMYWAYRTTSFPINPKRGKFLTWLIIIEALTLQGIVISGVVEHDLGRFSVVLIILEAVCLVGIWKWKKVAVLGLIGLLVVHYARNFIETILDHRYHSVVAVWLFLLIVVVWLVLWIKAFKQKWSLFT